MITNAVMFMLLIPFFFSFENEPRQIFLSKGESTDINDETKRNENWAYIFVHETEEFNWIPLGENNLVFDVDYTLFYPNGKIRERGRVVKGKNIDTVFYYDLNEKFNRYDICYSDSSQSFFVKDGEYSCYFPTGTLREKGVVEKLRRGVPWVEYYNDGRIKNECFKLEDTVRTRYYYDNGRLKQENNAVNGVFEGKYIILYEDGNLFQTGGYKAGKKDGEMLMYFEGGLLGQRTIFKNGYELSGENYRYYPNGQMSARDVIEDYVEGVIILTRWHPNGVIKYEGKVILGNNDGLHKIYYESGKLMTEVEFKNGLKHGKQIKYDQEGSVLEQGNFDQGVPYARGLNEGVGRK